MPKIERVNYDNSLNFLKSEHIVSFTDTAEEANATEGVVLAGTIVPANDETAVGIAFHDTEVGQPLAIIVEGHVYRDRLPVEPTTEAEAALKNIGFH